MNFYKALRRYVNQRGNFVNNKKKKKSALCPSRFPFFFSRLLPSFSLFSRRSGPHPRPALIAVIVDRRRRHLCRNRVM